MNERVLKDSRFSNAVSFVWHEAEYDDESESEANSKKLNIMSQ